MFSYTIPQWTQSLFRSLTWKVKTSEPKVYLTFDDGPHPEITPWVLEQLAQYNAKATFFCVGENVRRYPETYSMILAHGHRTGNHTFNHLNGWKVSDKRYFENIGACAGEVESDLFRPPYGKIKPSQISVLRRKYRIIMWNLLTRDFDSHATESRASAEIEKHLQPGAIIVFHDSEKAEPRLKKLLPWLLEYGMQKQYIFDKL